MTGRPVFTRTANAVGFGLRGVLVVRFWPGGRGTRRIDREEFGLRIGTRTHGMADVYVGRYAR